MCSNGVWQLEKLTVSYCKQAGSSVGVREFISTKLVDFAKENPQLKIHAKQKPSSHPVLIGQYAEVARHAWRLRNQSGHRVVDVGNPVRSKHESIQGVWSPATAFEKMEITFVEAR